MFRTATNRDAFENMLAILSRTLRLESPTNPPPAPAVTFDPATHLAALPYSSGTTGNPKGVMLTHTNLAANVAQIRPIQGLVPEDRVLAVLPFFHIYGMTVLLNSVLHARARLVIMPSFDLALFIKTIQDRGYIYKKGSALVPAWVAFAVVGLLGGGEDVGERRTDVVRVRGAVAPHVGQEGGRGEAFRERDGGARRHRHRPGGYCARRR